MDDMDPHATAVRTDEPGAMARIELLARMTWTEALFRCGKREEARAQTRELSAIAREVSRTSWNEYLFMGLQTRATKPAATPETM